MASENDHVTLANANHETLKYLMERPDRHPEWIATIAFYKAVQMIEASFAFTGEGTTSEHHERKHKLKTSKIKSYQFIFTHYRVLWEASTIARYLVDRDGKFKRFADFLPPQRVVAELVEHRLREIEQQLVIQTQNPRLLSAGAVSLLQRV